MTSECAVVVEERSKRLCRYVLSICCEYWVLLPMPTTTHFESETEYRGWVAMIAQNAVTMGDEESPTTVADQMIVDVSNVSSTDPTLTFSAEPYVDDPATQTRVYPKDVLAVHSPDELPRQCETYRDAAVHLLARDLEQELRQYRE